jgi:hypothetical protein
MLVRIRKFGLNCAVAHFEPFIVVATPLAKRRADQISTPESSSPLKSPGGDSLNLNTHTELLTWLQDRMTDKTKLVSRPHLLAKRDELKYSLEDRSEALESGRELLSTIYKSSTDGDASRAKYPIPVCSAMSGIGKSRLLDEFVDLVSDKDKDNFPSFPQSRLALVLSYGNGHAALPEEKSMGSVAGFSWRLLYAVFLEQNSAVTWEQFWPSISGNAAELTLTNALNTIAAAMKVNEHEHDELALFVGIDEFQLVPRNRVNTDKDPLVLLLEGFLAILINSPPGVVLLPMFAGTDWNKMSLAASASSSTTAAASVATKRLSMSLLSPEDMRRAVKGRGEGTDELLKQNLFCQHLFFLGGVPRPCTQYAEECLLWLETSGRKGDVGATKTAFIRIFESKFNEFFRGVYSQAPREKGEKEGFTLRELIWLAAYSVSGGTVEPDEKPFKNLPGSTRSHLSFRRLRDGSVCILDDDGRLGLPYCFFYYLSGVDELKYTSFSEGEKSFMAVLQYLKNYVDRNVFDPANCPWQQWELFGACFSALRINALLITLASDGELEVKLSRIFEGAVVNLPIDHKVKLRPMVVTQTMHHLTSDSPKEIKVIQEAEPINWVSTGVVVVNGENGKGIDIFYTLELHEHPGNYILVTDQRKRVTGNLAVNKTIKETRIEPGKDLKEAGIKHVVVALFSMFTCASLSLATNSIAVTFEQHSVFHGALHHHPAASYCVRVNNDGVTALGKLFEKGGTKGAEAIIAARVMGLDISSFAILKEVLKDVAATLWADTESLCSFSQ